MKISIEVFPPKPNVSFEATERVLADFAALNPHFISVTYGAGGSNKQGTVQIAKKIKSLGVDAMAHLTCVGSTRRDVDGILDELSCSGIEKILALRGDKPKDGVELPSDFPYASDLVRYIKKTRPEFFIAAACYPEGHPQSATKDEDVRILAEKVAEGVDLLVTQLFFDNAFYYDFAERLDKYNIKTPVECGIMPVTNVKSILRICELSCATIPSGLQKVLYANQDDTVSLVAAGVEYAQTQCQDLMSSGKCDGIHLYAMNKPAVASAIMKGII